MNKFDLVGNLIKLMEQKEKQDNRIDRKANELGAPELKKRIAALDALYPGQGKAMHDFLHDVLGEDLKNMIYRITDIAAIAPHSLADYAFDVTIYLLNGAIESVEIAKEEEFKRRETIKGGYAEEKENEIA